jgi:hypothetical protein
MAGLFQFSILDFRLGIKQCLLYLHFSVLIGSLILKNWYSLAGVTGSLVAEGTGENVGGLGCP